MNDSLAGSGKEKNLDPESLWQAVLRRDKSFDRLFFYAVRSTGTYCRPSCPSKLPRREQTIFFDSPEAAEQAGFRPCWRCLPHQINMQDPQAKLIQQACHNIEAYSGTKLTLTALGSQVHMSSHHLQRTFKNTMGITPKQYFEACRLRRLKTLLKEAKSIVDALYQAGYGSGSRLYEQAHILFGMTPGTYLQGGNGITIGYTIADSPLGRLLVAATREGVCRVSLGDSDAALAQELAGEYPAAEIKIVEGNLKSSVDSLLKYLADWQPHPSLPFDLQVTAYEWRVYEEMRSISFESICSEGTKPE